MINKMAKLTGSFFVLFAVLASNTHAATLAVDQVGAKFRNGGYTGGQVFQSFTPTQNNIAGVDIDFFISSGPKNLTLRLWDTEVLTGNLLLNLTTEVTKSCARNDLACVEFRFDPVAISPNKQIFMEFSWDGSGAIGAARSTTQNYLGGKVFCLKNCGNTADGDLAFVTYAATPVPVPAAAWLFVSALAGLGLF